MSPRVRIRQEAEQDLDEAAHWYERQQEGLGGAFLDEVLEAFDRIRENPLVYPVLHRAIRRALLHRFPFGVFYQIEDDRIVVLAVMHGSRHPNAWKQRG